jgi:hypothetical protein
VEEVTRTLLDRALERLPKQALLALASHEWRVQVALERIRALDDLQ